MGIAEQKITEKYAVYLGDCIETMKDFNTDMIDLSIYSPPFGGLYHYSSSERDLSNADSYGDFFEHYRFAVREIFRITKQGRCTAVHCSDIPSGNSGCDHLIDLPGDIIKLHEEEKFQFIARHCIWKDALMVRNRTMQKNLTHKTIVDDSAYGGVASADYVLIFRKKGQNKIPISHPNGFTVYHGSKEIPEDIIRFKNYQGSQTKNKYSHWIWRKYASSIWDDVRPGVVLPFQKSRDEDDEKHVHPLQLDIINRTIILRSNIDEVVFTPFMGVGSEVFCAVQNGRKGIGIELKESYYKQALLNLENVKSETGRLYD
jgi:DNA modification methylase